MTTPTTRETADHADHIGEATTMIDHAELARLSDDPAMDFGGFGRSRVLALLSEIAALREKELLWIKVAQKAQEDRILADQRATQAERQRDELRKALEGIGSMAPSTCETSLAHDMAQFANQAIANQGADQ